MSGRRAASYDVPKALVSAVGMLGPLVDEDGHPYPFVPCMQRPDWWDEDAGAAANEAARITCATRCPALDACNERRLMLGQLASGVWGGIILSKRSDSQTPIVTDATVAAWLSDAGMATHPEGETA